MLNQWLCCVTLVLKWLKSDFDISNYNSGQFSTDSLCSETWHGKFCQRLKSLYSAQESFSSFRRSSWFLDSEAPELTSKVTCLGSTGPEPVSPFVIANRRDLLGVIIQLWHSPQKVRGNIDVALFSLLNRGSKVSITSTRVFLNYRENVYQGSQVP